MNITVDTKLSSTMSYLGNQCWMPMQNDSRNKECRGCRILTRCINNRIQGLTYASFGKAKARENRPEPPNKVMQPFGSNRESDQIHLLFRRENRSLWSGRSACLLEIDKHFRL